jgi:hypothetical protein|tara:strand:- start:1973 stop:2170 length:198 start_codon:yes stop_codon:yes gene_type:complete
MLNPTEYGDITFDNLTGYDLPKLQKMYVAFMGYKNFCVTPADRAQWAAGKANLVAAQNAAQGSAK